MMKRNLLFLLTFIVSTMTVWAQEVNVELVASPSTAGSISFVSTTDHNHVIVTPTSDYHIDRVEHTYGTGEDVTIQTLSANYETGYYEVNSDLGGTVTAYFALNNFTISFNANGGEGNMESGHTSSSYTIPGCDFTKVGYVFMGWATSADGKVKYQPWQIITLTHSLTLYAKWGEHLYDVSFNANGGEGTMADDPASSSYIIPSCEFTRENYTFIGWATSDNGAVVYTPNQEIALTANLTLFAVWAANPTVTFYANGGTGTMNTVRPAYGSGYTIPSCSFVRDNYTFMGWATSDNGAVIYTPEQEITLTEDLTLYAKWAALHNGLKYFFTSENPYEVELMGYDGEKPTGTLTVPSDITIGDHNYSVTSIGQGAFYNTGLNSITIPASVTSIGQGAFNKCSDLTSVNFADGSQLTTIGQSAFYQTGLTSITIPASVTSIGSGAFDHTPWLNSQPDGVLYLGKVAYTYKGTMPENTNLVLNEGIMSIGDRAFEEYTGLTSVTIPNSVTSIGQDAFSWCTGLTSVTFADGSLLTSIGQSAFYQTGLTSVTIPNSVTSIGQDAFSWCTGLTSVTFADGSLLTSIGQSAFYQTGLTSITIPASVTSIGDDAFSTCTGLTSLTFADGSHLTTIGQGAFYQTGLTSIAIPISVTSIGESAFWKCASLTSITIPNSVTYIGHFAFADCTNLTSVTIYAPSLTDYCIGVFENNASGRKIYVFNDCVNAYKSGWSKYADDIEPITEVAVSGVSANQNPESAADYWCTYYHPAANVIINTAGVEIYKAKINDNKTSVTLEKVEGNVIKAGQAVMLKAPASGSLSMELTPNAATGDYTDNDLKGGTTVETGYTAYTLAAKNNKMGFYKFTGTALNGNKAHLELPTIAASRAFIGFDAETTKIVNTDCTDNADKGDGQIYDLQGRKVQQPVRGIYVQNGKKIVVK